MHNIPTTKYATDLTPWQSFINATRSIETHSNGTRQNPDAMDSSLQALSQHQPHQSPPQPQQPTQQTRFFLRSHPMSSSTQLNSALNCVRMPGISLRIMANAATGHRDSYTPETSAVHMPTAVISDYATMLSSQNLQSQVNQNEHEDVSDFLLANRPASVIPPYSLIPHTISQISSRILSNENRSYFRAYTAQNNPLSNLRPERFYSLQLTSNIHAFSDTSTARKKGMTLTDLLAKTFVVTYDGLPRKDVQFHGILLNQFKQNETYSKITECFSSDGDSMCICVICCTYFEQGEPVRCIQDCCHRFHVSCIDKWFEINDTCPICRCPLSESSEPNLPSQFSPPPEPPNNSARESDNSFNRLLGHEESRETILIESDPLDTNHLSDGLRFSEQSLVCNQNLADLRHGFDG